MMKTIVLLFSFQLAQSLLTVININNGSQLIDVLCNNGQLGEDVRLVLDSSMQYHISLMNTGCVVGTVPSHGQLEISSSTDDTFASITCINQSYTEHIPTIGFVFSNMTNITLSNLNIFGCAGASLGQYTELNMTQPYFTSDHSGLFIFINTSTSINKVTIAQYDGFAVIVKDPQKVLLEKLTIANNTVNISNQKSSKGSGMIILYTEQLNHPLSITRISNSNFHNNSDYQSEKSCHMTETQSLGHNVINSASLTVILNNNMFIPTISVSETNFMDNLGQYSGSILILMTNSVGVIGDITKTKFVVRIPQKIPLSCAGSIVTIYGNSVKGSVSVRVDESYFQASRYYDMNMPTVDFTEYGPILINMVNMDEGHAKIQFVKTNFSQNSPSINGGCLTITGNSNAAANVEVILESLVAYNNAQDIWGSFLYNTGLFVFDKIDKIIINGTESSPSQFHNNTGSVFHAKGLEIILDGHVEFYDNHAIKGAAIYSEDTLLHFCSGLELKMVRNTAEKIGGAIYVVNSIREEYQRCALQFDLSTTGLNISSVDNHALVGGNVVYAYPIYGCYNLKSNVVHSTNFYLDIFGIKNASQYTNNTLLPISTRGYKFDDDCENSSSDALQTLYSGQTKSIYIRVIDRYNNTVWSKVTVSLQQKQFNDLLIRKSEMLQLTNENVNGNCSGINITAVFSSSDIPADSESRNFTVILTASNVKTFVTRQLKLLKCPPGFELKDTAVCQCSIVTERFFKDVNYKGECNIDDLIISKPIGIFPWLGIDPSNNKFTISENCPTAHCAVQFRRTIFKYSSTINNYGLVSSTNPYREPKLICLPHRQGVSCGKCAQDYSVVFGSDECKECSNWWLLTLLIYLIAGPLLIYVLYALKLTLTTGTINGIIFFAQVSYAGLIQSISTWENDSTYIRRTFLATLNLSVGFPLCFYDGMSQLTKGVLGLLFPMYLLFLIGLIVIISRFSSWFTEKVSPYSIQLLVTVVHLSISTLLTLVIDVSIPINVWTADGTHYVWRRDGSIAYLSTYHALLFTMTMVVVALILIPYLAVLLFGRWFSKRSSTCSIYIRPIHEAVHAPYKEKYRYWFTGRLLFIIILYSLYAFNRSSNNKSAPAYVGFMLTVLLFTQASFRPLKSILLNMIELLFVFTAAASFFALYFTVKNIDHDPVTVTFSLSVYSAMIIFIGILIYHFILVTGSKGKVIKVLQKFKEWFENFFAAGRKNMPENPHSDSNLKEELLGSFFEDPGNREPLVTTQIINL